MSSAFSVLLRHAPAQRSNARNRFDTATPAADPVLLRRVELPGGWNLDDYNTTQARLASRHGCTVVHPRLLQFVKHPLCAHCTMHISAGTGARGGKRCREAPTEAG